jgi:heavy metal translocating P-type ATPase
MVLEMIGVTGAGMYIVGRPKKSKLLRQKRRGPKKDLVMPFTGSAREQQIKEFSADNVEGKSQRKKLNDRNMNVALVSMALAGAGNVFYPPLTLLSLPGIAYITQFAIREGLRSLMRDRKLTVDSLSAIMKILLVANGYFFFASFSVFMFCLNRKLLDKISDDSKKNIIDVFKQQPSTVWVLAGGVEFEIPFEQLKRGDVVVVGAGGVIPVDGVIADGTASVDQHILTGESQPAEKGQGDEVFALTLVLAGKILVDVRETGERTTAAEIANILNNTISTKTDVQLWSKEISDRTVLPTFVLGVIALPFLGRTGALGLVNSHFKYRATIASAIGVLNYLDKASHHGILVKDGHTFEVLKTVDTLVFDKTGTLTEEQPTVASIHAIGGVSEEEVLRLAAGAETRQRHPIARAILDRAEAMGLQLPVVEEAAYKVGYGLTVGIEGKVVRVGSLRFLREEGIPTPQSLNAVQERCHERGSPMVAVANGDTVVGAIELMATVRAGTRAIIRELVEHCGVQSTYIISGDHEAPTRRLAEELGIDGYFAEVLPEEKGGLVAGLRRSGKSVCYIGDGINDAIALQEADVSISIRGASTVATDSAQIILMDQTLERLPYLFKMGRRFNGHMRQVVTVVMIPTLVSAGAAILFPQLALIQSVFFPQIGLLAGIATAMRPGVGSQRGKRS